MISGRKGLGQPLQVYGALAFVALGEVGEAFFGEERGLVGHDAELRGESEG